MKDEYEDIYVDDEQEDDDFFSPTSWDQHADETDEEYEERIQDQEDLMEYYDD